MSVLFVQQGVVGQCPSKQCAAYLCQQRSFLQRLVAVMQLYGAVGGVAGAAEIDPSAGGDQGADGHFVAGQSAGFVRADHRR